MPAQAAIAAISTRDKIIFLQSLQNISRRNLGSDHGHAFCLFHSLGHHRLAPLGIEEQHLVVVGQSGETLFDDEPHHFVGEHGARHGKRLASPVFDFVHAVAALSFAAEGVGVAKEKGDHDELEAGSGKENHELCAACEPAILVVDNAHDVVLVDEKMDQPLAAPLLP